MTLRTTLAAASLLAGLALPAVVLAQAEMTKEVVAGGGGTATSAGHTMRITIGQPAVGPVSGANYDLDIGFWYGGGSDLTPVAEDLPAVFELDQNYPNPFNPMTVVSFSLPETVPVQLSVYNVRGQRVRLLLDETRAAGHHEVIWNGTDDSGRGVSSGTYIARIESSAGILNRKMVLAR